MAGNGSIGIIRPASVKSNIQCRWSIRFIGCHLNYRQHITAIRNFLYPGGGYFNCHYGTVERILRNANKIGKTASENINPCHYICIINGNPLQPLTAKVTLEKCILIFSRKSIAIIPGTAYRTISTECRTACGGIGVTNCIHFSSITDKDTDPCHVLSMSPVDTGAAMKIPVMITDCRSRITGIVNSSVV